MGASALFRDLFRFLDRREKEPIAHSPLLIASPRRPVGAHAPSCSEASCRHFVQMFVSEANHLRATTYVSAANHSRLPA